VRNSNIIALHIHNAYTVHGVRKEQQLVLTRSVISNW